MNLGESFKMDLNLITPEELKKRPEIEDRWILSRYQQTVSKIRELLDSYAFGEASKVLYEFIWGDFCDWYIEQVKSRLTESFINSNDEFNSLEKKLESQKLARQVLAFVLDGLLRLLHPFMPHITEEIWHNLSYESSSPSAGKDILAIMPYPDIEAGYIDEYLEKQVQLGLQVIRTIRSLRAEADIKHSQKIKKAEFITENREEREILNSILFWISALAGVEELSFNEHQSNSDDDKYLSALAGTIEVLVYLDESIDLTKLVAKLERTLKKLEGAIASSQARLNNEGYIKKAPPDLVATARAELEESLKQQNILQARLAQLQK